MISSDPDLIFSSQIYGSGSAALELLEPPLIFLLPDAFLDSELVSQESFVPKVMIKKIYIYEMMTSSIRIFSLNLKKIPSFG